ncbi:AMP-binding protein [Streptomyces sp. NPDC098781]|uniref:AMP-binding protein n=1 Tax=Streptomyces sp. NPDC098781 TaxID=3366097 RepID=UPI0037FAFE28
MTVKESAKTVPLLERSVGALFEQACRSYPDRVAVVHGDQRVTYAELRSEVRRAGRAFLRLGLRKGDRLAIIMKDRPELLAIQYGALWAGLVVVPLNTRQGAEDNAYAAENAGARALCHDAAHAAVAEEMRGRGTVEHFIGVDAQAVLDAGLDFAALNAAEDDGAAGLPEVAPDDLMAIYYTGGTTGRPKGVAHSHRTYLAAVMSELLEMSIEGPEVFAHVAPLTHASGVFVLPVLMRGGTHVILGGFDPKTLLETIERERVTATFMVPTMLYVLMDHMDTVTSDTSTLRTIIYGAAPMGRERLVEAMERFGPILTQVYGQTEAPNQLAVLRKEDHAEALASGDPAVLSSCGRPVAVADVRLVDDDGNDVPAGELGEIVVRGPHVMLGYWNKPEETAQALVDGWLHTGDIARADERGFLYIVDRKKDMIISGGYNVYPKDVEAALFAHPAVRDVCVIGVPDAKWGEAVKAVVVADEVREEELMAWVRERKGPLCTPKSVDLVDAIPVTALGKHDKPALRSAYWGSCERAVN